MDGQRQRVLESDHRQSGQAERIETTGSKEKDKKKRAAMGGAPMMQAAASPNDSVGLISRVGRDKPRLGALPP